MSNEIGQTDLARNWSLTFSEMEFIQTFGSSAWLDVAVQMLAFRNTGLFPSATNIVKKAAIEYLNSQLSLSGQGLDWKMPNVRTLQRRRKEIRSFYEIVPMSDQIEAELRDWLSDKHRKRRATVNALVDHMPLWCFSRKVEMLPAFRADRLATSVIAEFDEKELERIFVALDTQTQTALKSSMRGTSGDPSFAQMKADPGRVGLKTFVKTVKQVQFIKSLDLPDDLVFSLGTEFNDRYYRRALNEDSWDMSRKADGPIGNTAA